MLLLWVFGVMFFFCAKDFDYLEDNISLNNCITEIILSILIMLTGLSLMVAYQILFACILAPFMLISFCYHKFFDKMRLFFELS